MQTDTIKLELQQRLTEIEELIEECTPDPRFAAAVRSAKVERWELQRLITQLDGDPAACKAAIESAARLREREKTNLRAMLDRLDAERADG